MKRTDKRYWVESYWGDYLVYSRNYQVVCKCYSKRMANRIVNLLNKDVDIKKGEKP